MSPSFLRAVVENGPAESWDIGAINTEEWAQKLYDIFKPHLLKVKDCGLKQGCFYNGTCKALNAPSFIWHTATYSLYARRILSDGTAFLLWSGGRGCNFNLSSNGIGKYSKGCGVIVVDINGHKPSNQAGVDLFRFEITKDGVLPSGGENYKSFYSEICKYNDTSNRNGRVCTAWVIAKGNMDYLRRDISNEC